MKIIGKQESAGGFPCGFLFSVLFPPFPKLVWEGGKKGGWVSNYPCGLEQLCYNGAMHADVLSINILCAGGRSFCAPSWYANSYLCADPLYLKD